MSIDPGSTFRDWLAGEVERIARRMMSTASSPVAAQLNGTPMSDGHRTLNFTGPGVSVVDDAAGRRANVFIPGTTIVGGTTTTTIVSSTSAHCKTLWTGSTNSAPPASWQTAGFSEDATWTAAHDSTADYAGAGSTFPNIAGAAAINKEYPSLSSSEQNLIRHSFTLPGGTVTSAGIQVTVDDVINQIYLDGTLIGTSAGSVTLTAGQVAAGTHLLAIWFSNTIGTAHAVGYKLTVTYSSPGASYALIQDQKTQNTSGGNFASGAWRTRNLTTIVTDDAGITSLASNQITLQSGGYRFHAVVPAFGVGRHQAKLQNITSSSVLLIGTTGFADNSGVGQTVTSEIFGKFAISGATVLEIQHQCQTTNANGFGIAANFATEIYTSVEIYKDS